MIALKEIQIKIEFELLRMELNLNAKYGLIHGQTVKHNTTVKKMNTLINDIQIRK